MASRKAPTKPKAKAKRKTAAKPRAPAIKNVEVPKEPKEPQEKPDTAAVAPPAAKPMPMQRELLKLNRRKAYSEVMGMRGVAYMQNGYYFDKKGVETGAVPQAFSGLSDEEMAEAARKHREELAEAQSVLEHSQISAGESASQENAAALAAERSVPDELS